MDRLLEELIALECSALDRWIRLDPHGYLDIFAAEVTYFDPFAESASGRGGEPVQSQTTAKAGQ